MEQRSGKTKLETRCETFGSLETSARPHAPVPTRVTVGLSVQAEAGMLLTRKDQ